MLPIQDEMMLSSSVSPLSEIVFHKSGMVIWHFERFTRRISDWVRNMYRFWRGYWNKFFMVSKELLGTKTFATCKVPCHWDVKIFF